MPKLTLIRGLPGSGKSTVAQKLWQEVWLDNLDDATVRPPDRWEADDFFTHSFNHEYHFDGALIRDAHAWCYSNTLKSLRDGMDVIVSNTFTQVWEIKKYLLIQEYVPGVEIEIIEVKTQFESIHGVPEEKIRQMSARWESIPQDVVDSCSATVRVILPEVLDAYNEERLVSRYDKGAVE